MVEMKIFLIGNGYYLNRGCEAIVRGTLRILEAVYPDSRVENYFFGQEKDLERGFVFARADQSADIPQKLLPSAGPDPRFSFPWFLYQLGRRMGPHALGYLGCRQFENAFRSHVDSADVALQIGGDNYSLDYGFPLKHAVLDRSLKRKGVPVILWGASVGPFGAGSRTEKWMVTHLQRNVELILVRETASLDYLRKVGLGSKTFLMGDPGFVMDPVLPPPALLESIETKGTVGVNLSPMLHRFRSNGNNMRQWIHEAGILIRHLHECLNRPILLIPHVTQTGNDDHEFMQQAVREAGVDLGNVKTLPPNLTAAELKWVISRLDMLIAARTHATIAGFSSHVPTISIAYSVKALGLNQLVFGHNKFVIPMRELSPTHLVNLTRTVLEQAGDIRAHLSETVPRIRKSAFEAGTVLKEYLLMDNA